MNPSVATEAMSNIDIPTVTNMEPTICTPQPDITNVEDNDVTSIMGGNGLDTEEDDKDGDDDERIEVVYGPTPEKPDAIDMRMLVSTMTLKYQRKPYLNNNPKMRRMILVVV